MKIGIVVSEEKEREGEGEKGSNRLLHAANPLQIVASFFPYDISSSPFTEAAIGFLSLYEIRISIFELRFSFWFCGLFFIFEDSA